MNLYVQSEDTPGRGTATKAPKADGSQLVNRAVSCANPDFVLYVAEMHDNVQPPELESYAD